MRRIGRRYATFAAAVLLSVTVCLAFASLIRQSSGALILFFIFKDGAGIPVYVATFAFLSLPAIPVFKIFMNRFTEGFSWPSTLICWLIGLTGAGLAVRVSASTAIVTPLSAVVIYFITVFSAGFLLADWLGDKDDLHKNKVGTHPEWEEYS